MVMIKRTPLSPTIAEMNKNAVITPKELADMVQNVQYKLLTVTTMQTKATQTEKQKH